MFFLIYQTLSYVLLAIVVAIVSAMTLRLVLDYADPNPFGALGRFASWLKKKTADFVLPIADFLGSRRVDRRLAPLLVSLFALVLGYFAWQILFDVFYMLNGVVGSLANNSLNSAVGYLLTGAVVIYSFLIFMRLLSTWVLSYGSKIRLFLAKICDPVLLPFRRLIPPIGMIDLSPLLVMILLGVLQMLIARLLITAPVAFR